VAGIVRQEPSLLARSQASLQRSFATVQQLLGCSRAQAANLVVRRPALLTTSVRWVGVKGLGF